MEGDVVTSAGRKVVNRMEPTICSSVCKEEGGTDAVKGGGGQVVRWCDGWLRAGKRRWSPGSPSPKPNRTQRANPTHTNATGSSAARLHPYAPNVHNQPDSTHPYQPTRPQRIQLRQPNGLKRRSAAAQPYPTLSYLTLPNLPYSIGHTSSISTKRQLHLNFYVLHASYSSFFRQHLFL